MTHRQPALSRFAISGLLPFTLLMTFAFAASGTQKHDPEILSFILQGEDATSVAELVRQIGGEVTHDLHLIDAVAARLTPGQLQKLQDATTLSISENRTVKVSGSGSDSDSDSDSEDSDSDSDSECLAGIGGMPEVSGNVIRWTITNGGYDKIKIKSIEITWPEQNGKLKRIKLGNNRIYDRNQPAPSAVVDSDWTGRGRDRKIRPMRSKQLKFRFKHDVDPDETQYALTVTFKQGCSATYQSVLDDGFPVLETNFPTRVNADQLHAQGITGAGVTVAFIDTGNSTVSDTIHYNAARQWRFLAQYDAIGDVLLDTNTFGPNNPPADQDLNGHGSHLISTALSAKRKPDGNYNGIAPGADLVSIRAFDERGDTTYADVIRGVQFAVDFRTDYGIQVLNLAFNGPAVTYYWRDPLNQAVTAAWNAGLVVVTSAGNGGPGPMTVGVPGSNPYAITAGAISDNSTPDNPADDFLTSFSAAGPTIERFIKPEVVAPGSGVLGMASYTSFRALTFPEGQVGFPYFQMSGTSPAAAITTGVVALMLEADPSLSNNDVKCRLIATARAAEDENGSPAYSAFQQGAGLIDAAAAVASTATGCANPGLDAEADLNDTEHFFGMAEFDPDTGQFFIAGFGGDIWDGSYTAGAHPWNDGEPWTEFGSVPGACPWLEASPWLEACPWLEANPWPVVNPFLENNPWLELTASPWLEACPWLEADAFPEGDDLSRLISVNSWVTGE